MDAIIPLEDLPPVPVPSDSLGFLVTRESEDVKERIRRDALTSVEIISRELALKAVDPRTAMNHVISINDQLIRLAGLDKKATDGAPGEGPGVSITINIPSLDAVPAKTITIDQSAKPDETVIYTDS